MAKLNGMSIKKLKSYEGWEGIAYQGDLYLGSKRIGFWSQDGNGGPDRFDFDSPYSESKFEHLVQVTHEPHRYREMEIPFDGELFMGRLLDMTLSEKTYKKYVKQGYDLVVRAGSEHTGDYIYAFRDTSEEDAKAKIAGDLKPKLDMLQFEESIEFTVYRSLDDFVSGDPYSLDDITA